MSKDFGLVPYDKWTVEIARTVNRVISKFNYPVFGYSDPYLKIKGIGEKKDVFLWRAEEKVFGKLLPSYYQIDGTCVSKGWGRAAQDQMLIDIVIRGQQEQIPAHLKRDLIIATEPSYIGSREEVGGGRLGNGQGSIGHWMADWYLKWGALFRQKYGQYDFTKEDDTLVRGWRGVPQELEDAARPYPIAEASLCETWEEFRDATVTWNNVTICSNQGFTITRQSGFCVPRGTWYHCMVGRGVGVAKGNRPFGVIQNSWGQQNPSGSKYLTLETGEEIELPNGCFAADAEVIDRMLRQKDSHVVSGIKGFRSELIDYTLL